MIIDTHCHLDKEYYENIEEVINNFTNGIMIASAASIDSNYEVLELANKFSNVYCTLGIHPDYANYDYRECLDFIEKNINNKKVVGIGEIGLDYHYDGYDKIKQIQLFERQIELAKKYNKTIVVHTRDAVNDTYEVLDKMKANQVNITIHCFSESLEMANRFIKLGCKLGVGGVVTFKNGRKLKEVVENIDISHLLLETDSPYLAPEPLRGTRNEPNNVYLVAEKIAQLKNMSADDVIMKTYKNSVKQYNMEV